MWFCLACIGVCVCVYVSVCVYLYVLVQGGSIKLEIPFHKVEGGRGHWTVNFTGTQSNLILYLKFD